jgi:lipopolysaccharide exporter
LEVPQRHPAHGLTHETLGGLRWTYLSLAGSALVQLIFTVLVSRLLRPLEFGIFAAAMVVINFGRHFGQLGLGPAIVQRGRLSAEHVRSAATVGALLALASAGLMLLVARPLAGVLDTVEATSVLMVLSADLALTALAITPLSLLRRSLRFRRLSMIEISASATGYLVVGVSAAAAGLGIWSLVLAVLVYDAVTLVLAYAAVRHPLLPRLRWKEIAPLLNYGGTLSVVGVLEYAQASIDTVALARYTTPAALGQFNRAMALVSVPFNRLAFGLSRVLFPAFSSVQTERHRIARGYRLAFLTVGGLIGPAAGGLAGAAEDFVLVLLGGQWAFAGMLLPLVLVVVATSTLTQFGGIVADALGAVRLKLLLQVAVLAVLIPSVIWIAPRGARAIVAVVALVSLARLIVNVVMAAYLLRLRVVAQVLDLARILAAGGVTYLLVRAAVAPISGPRSGLRLSLAVVAGGLSLLGLWLVGPFAGTRRELAARVTPLVGSAWGRRALARLGGPPVDTPEPPPRERPHG